MRAPNEQFAQVGDVELCYETFGEPGKPAVLLVMGLGTQMLGWHEDFCEQLLPPAPRRPQLIAHNYGAIMAVSQLNPLGT